MICIFSKYYFCDQIKVGEPGQTCGTDRGEQKVFLLETWRKETTWKA